MRSIKPMLKAAAKRILQDLQDRSTVKIGDFIFTRLHAGKKYAILNAKTGLVIWSGGKKLTDDRALLLLELLDGDLKEFGKKIRLMKLLRNGGFLAKLWLNGCCKVKSSITFLKVSPNAGFFVYEYDDEPRAHSRFKKFEKVTLPKNWTWDSAELLLEGSTALSPDGLAQVG